MATAFDTFAGVVDKPRALVETNGQFWRRDDPVLDAEGKVVMGGMLDHQRRWWDLPNFIKVMVGGYGAGKTLIQSKRIISLALQNHGVPVATVSPTFPLARQTIIPTIKSLLWGKRTLLGRDFWWKYNQSYHEFRIRYHGRSGHIICYSGEDPESLRGPNLGAAAIDEPFLQDKEIFTQMIARVRHPDAVHRELILGGTPEQLGWGYDLCMGTGDETYDVGMVKASTRNNFVLPKDYVKRLEGALTSKAAEAYIDGEFRNLSAGQVYYGFGPENVLELEMPEKGTYELGCGMDFNVNPFAFVVFWRKGPHVHVFKEYELENADTEYACSTLRQDFGEHLRVVYPDASGHNRHTSAPGGRSDFWYIRNAGFEVSAPPSNPHRKDRYNAVNGRFKPKVGGPLLTVDKKCKKLVKALSTYTHELMHKQEALSHILDAFSYPIHRMFPIQNERALMTTLSGV